MTMSASTDSALADRAGALLRAAPHPQRSAQRWLLPMVLAGQAMAAMDTSIANVAAPAMRADLGISGALLQTAVAGYVLAYAVFLITGARLGDDHGYRRLFIIGVALFTVSSLACGLSPNTATLVVGRVLQGLGAALLVPQVLSLIQRCYEGPARARAIGYYSMILGLGATAGQLLGGIIVSLDAGGLGWRPAFLINVPIGLVLLAGARHVLPDLRGDQVRPLDKAGVFTLTVSMLLIVVPLTFGHEAGWPAWTGVALAIGAAGLALFLRHESRLERAGGSPLLHLGALRTPGIRPGLLVVAIGFVGYGGWLFATALYLQSGLGFAALHSGAVFAAYAFGFGISNVHWSKLPARFLRWTPTAALGLMLAANLLYGLGAWQWQWWAPAMLPLLFLAGASHGLSFGTTVHQMTARMPAPYAPVLSGLVTTSVQLSIVLGIAALGSLYLAFGVAGSVEVSSQAMARVAFTIAIAALFAIACALRLASLAPVDERRLP